MGALISLSSGTVPPTSKTTVSSINGTVAWNPRMPGLEGDSIQNAVLLTSLSYFLIQRETVMTSLLAVALMKVPSGITTDGFVEPAAPKSTARSSAYPVWPPPEGVQ